LLNAPCPTDARPGRIALKILLLTGKRTGELLLARWPEVDFEAATWRIPEANRKGKMHAAIGDEVVPLSAAAVAAFKELRNLARDSEWVVASPYRKASSRGHMRETALNKTVCERLLGHALPTVARTYDTGSYLEQRRNALENWAAYLERIAGSGAKVVALPDGSV